MITAEFYLRNDESLCGFSIRGHAEYAEYGSDIVCASVTSAVEMTANGITEILKVSALVESFNDEVRLMLPKEEYPAAVDFLRALRLHLALLSQDYSQNLKITDVEV